MFLIVKGWFSYLRRIETFALIWFVIIEGMPSGFASMSGSQPIITTPSFSFVLVICVRVSIKGVRLA